MKTLSRMRRARAQPKLPIFGNWTHKSTVYLIGSIVPVFKNRKKCCITPPYYTLSHVSPTTIKQSWDPRQKCILYHAMKRIKGEEGGPVNLTNGLLQSLFKPLNQRGLHTI